MGVLQLLKQNAAKSGKWFLFLAKNGKRNGKKQKENVFSHGLKPHVVRIVAGSIPLVLS